MATDGRRSKAETRLLAVFALLSLGAVGLGALICAGSGVTAATWGRNLAAWAVGGALATALAMLAPPRAAVIALPVALLGVGATLFAPGQDGVHRWVALGPVYVNVAMLLLPAAAIGFASETRGRGWPWAVAFALLALLVWQPDASQATAWALVMILVAAREDGGRTVKALLMAGAAVMAAMAWARPDPLAPVAEVEEVFRLGWEVSPALAITAAVLLAACALTPLTFSRWSAGAARIAGAALSLMLVTWAVMPALGDFPAPLVGVGMSPVVGAWLGVGLLAARWRAPPVTNP